MHTPATHNHSATNVVQRNARLRSVGKSPRANSSLRHSERAWDKKTLSASNPITLRSTPNSMREYSPTVVAVVPQKEPQICSATLRNRGVRSRSIVSTNSLRPETVDHNSIFIELLVAA